MASSVTTSISMMPPSGSGADGDGSGRASARPINDGALDSAVTREGEQGLYRMHPEFGVVDIYEFGRRLLAKSPRTPDAVQRTVHEEWNMLPEAPNGAQIGDGVIVQAGTQPDLPSSTFFPGDQ